MKMTFVNLYSITEDVGYVISGWIDISKRKECPNCFAMFVKDENRHHIPKDKMANTFYKCPFCGCRIKAFQETVVNY